MFEVLEMAEEMGFGTDRQGSWGLMITLNYRVETAESCALFVVAISIKIDDSDDRRACHGRQVQWPLVYCAQSDALEAGGRPPGGCVGLKCDHLLSGVYVHSQQHQTALHNQTLNSHSIGQVGQQCIPRTVRRLGALNLL